jgi:hypothetical protein
MQLFKDNSYSELLVKYHSLLTNDSALNTERAKLNCLTELIQPEVEKAKDLESVEFTVDVTDIETMEYDYLGLVMGQLESPYVYCKYFKLKDRLYLTCAKEKSKAYKRLNHLEYWFLLISGILAVSISPLVRLVTLWFFKGSYDPTVPNPFDSTTGLVTGQRYGTYVTTFGLVPAFIFFGSLIIAMLIVLWFVRYSKYSPYNKNVIRWSNVQKS